MQLLETEVNENALAQIRIYNLYLFRIHTKKVEELEDRNKRHQEKTYQEVQY